MDETLGRPVDRPGTEAPVLGAPRLSLWQKVFYGAGDSTNSMSGTIIDLFLLFYFTDVLGLKPVLAGLVLLIGRIFDAINDPVMGYLSDRSKSRFGRRRIFMALSAVPLGVTYIFIWRIPADVSDIAKVILAILLYILYDTFSTMFAVPFQALGNEISQNYDERTSLVAWRMLFSILTGLISTVVPMMIVNSIQVVFPADLLQSVNAAVTSGALPPNILDIMRGGLTSTNGSFTQEVFDKVRTAVSSGLLPAGFIDGVNTAVTAAKRIGYPLVGLIFGISFIIFPFFPVIAFRERTDVERKHEPFLKSMGLILRDVTFRRILGFYFLVWATIGIIMAYMMYYFKYYLHMESSFDMIAGGMFVVAALALPLWVKISAKYDKKIANVVGTLIFGGILFTLLLPADVIKAVWFTIPGIGLDVSLLIPMVIVIGIGLAAAHVMPNAIMPEAVDSCRLSTGIHSEGAYYGALNFCFKAGRAVSILLASAALQWSGYQEVSDSGITPQAQPASAILMIQLIMGLVAPLLICSSVIVLRKYRIGRAEHQEILRKLAERDGE